jgi:hypothetical protein
MHEKARTRGLFSSGRSVGRSPGYETCLAGYAALPPIASAAAAKDIVAVGSGECAAPVLRSLAVQGNGSYLVVHGNQ